MNHSPITLALAARDAEHLAIDIEDRKRRTPAVSYPPIDAYTDRGHTDAELRALLADYYAETWAMRPVDRFEATEPRPTSSGAAGTAPATPPDPSLPLAS